MIKLIEERINENRTQERIIKSNTTVLLLHMLKCKYQKDYQDKSSWIGSILNSFEQILNEFKGVGKGSLYRNFYMKKFDLQKQYESAVDKCLNETPLERDQISEICEWSKEELVDRIFIRTFIEKYR